MRAIRWWLILPMILVSAALGIGFENAPPTNPPKRTLLYPATLDAVPPSLQPFVRKLTDPKQATVEADGVKATGVFARVISRKYVLDGEKLKPGGVLGSRPFVFATVPESLYGRDLLQVFSAIGYSADEVLTGQIGEEKVVVVFRWNDPITLHSEVSGKLPEKWEQGVYPATWPNLFSLVEAMAADGNWHTIESAGQKPSLMKLNLKSPRERNFVLGFPDAGKQRLVSTAYSSLRDTKGADWEYRSLLQRTMSAAEHFTGDGRSLPTFVANEKIPLGFPEFIGPNRELTQFRELAVIGLGALQITTR